MKLIKKLFKILYEKFTGNIHKPIFSSTLRYLFYHRCADKISKKINGDLYTKLHANFYLSLDSKIAHSISVQLRNDLYEKT